MSVLETPHILFRGKVAWDPITTNNYSTMYDEAAASWGQIPAETAQAFRDEAITAVENGNWNPGGTHRSTFFDTQISGVDTGGGVVTDDPFVSAPVGFQGMLVDCEPYGAFSSQLFFDALSLGIAGGCRIYAPRTTRFTARYINFRRNGANRMIAGVASVIWQTAFAKADGLQIDAFDSPALQALATALEDPGVLGLTVRWNSYFTVYYDDPSLGDASDPAKQKRRQAARAAELQAKLLGGGFQPNPARSEIVGVVGLWRTGEPIHEPGDRALLSSEGATAFGTAFARIDGDTLTLDLGNSVSEVDQALTKQNLGQIDVVARDASGTDLAVLGSLAYADYDKAAYDRASGLVTLKLDPSGATIAADADLCLRQSNGTVLATESALRAIPLTPNLYLDQGDTKTAVAQVYARGVPVGAGVPVTIAASASSVTVTSVASTDANGQVAFDVIGSQGQVNGFVFVPGADAVVPMSGIDPQVTTYMYARTLPDNGLEQVPATWANVYNAVLINWYAMAPCMDNWLRLDDPAQVHAYGPLLKTLTDPANFEAFRFMPVVRDMTADSRGLLYRFLDGPAPGAAKVAERMTVTLVEESAHEPTNAELSRAMRGN